MPSDIQRKAAGLLEKTNLTVLALIGIIVPVLLPLALFLALKRRKEVAEFELAHGQEIEGDPKLASAFSLAKKRIKGAIVIPTVVLSFWIFGFLAGEVLRR